MIEIIGGPDRDRTDDLFHAITPTSCNLLILGAPAAPQGILKHQKSSFSTFDNTFGNAKEEVLPFGFRAATDSIFWPS